MLTLKLGHDVATIKPDSDDAVAFWGWALHHLAADVSDENDHDHVPHQEVRGAMVVSIHAVADLVNELKAEGFRVGG